MKVAILCLLLTGCSLVQWIPSSNCEHVKYERHHDEVEVVAKCRV